jgi:hypothetical protein
MAISCIKLITGEDLIGDITHEGDICTIESPLSIVMVPTQQGSFNVGLAPYMVFSATKKFSFHRDHIVVSCDVADELRNEYQRITGRGIIIASTPKLELLRD